RRHHEGILPDREAGEPGPAPSPARVLRVVPAGQNSGGQCRLVPGRRPGPGRVTPPRCPTVTEQEGTLGVDPRRMLPVVYAGGSPRKVALFACGCCRSAWERLAAWAQQVVADAERWADGEAEDNRLMATLITVAPADLEQMFFEFGVPLPEGIATALRPGREGRGKRPGARK